MTDYEKGQIKMERTKFQIQPVMPKMEAAIQMSSSRRLTDPPSHERNQPGTHDPPPCAHPPGQVSEMKLLIVSLQENSRDNLAQKWEKNSPSASKLCCFPKVMQEYKWKLLMIFCL
jgi:hypothetical protein